jgi:WD40 repeat protein
VAFSPDGQTLAGGNDDGRTWLWNLANPAHPTQLRQLLTGSSPSVTSMAFSRDGHILAAGSNDGTVWLWKLANTARLTPLGQALTGPRSPVTSVAFSPDGQTLAAGSRDYNVWLWDLNVRDAIRRVCAVTSNVLTSAQWHQYIPLPYDPPCADPSR